VSARILVVDDVPANVKLLEARLSAEYFDVLTAANGAEALQISQRAECDIILLDVMMPDMDGFEVCRRLKSNPATHFIPVVMITALDSPADRVRGLEAGADDYLTKPFAFRELVARLRALARRRPALLPAEHRIGDLVVDLQKRTVERGGTQITLTTKEFALLEFFILHRDMVVDRAAITAHVWDENHDPFTNVLEVLIRRLRRKIDDRFEPKLIYTVRGAGYRFGIPS
jgi:DNA-binding response OmpR family regulator